MTSPGQSWRVLAAVTAGYAAVALIFTWPIALHPATTTTQPFGDPLLNAWILAWDADRFLHGFHGFWTGLFFYPYPDTVAYSEHLLGIALFTAPVQWLTGNPIFALNVALIGSMVLAGLGMWLLARDLCGRADVAFVAGLAFACAPARASHVTHVQVLASGWIPVSLWALARYLRTRERRWLVAWIAAFLLNAASNGYYLFFAAVPTAVILAHGMWTGRAHVRRILADMAVACAAILAGLAPLVLAYLRVRHDQGLGRTLSDVVLFSPGLSAYLQVNGRLWLWGHVLASGPLEQQLFPGLVVVVLAAAALVGTRGAARSDPDARLARSQAILYLGIAALALVLSLGPQPHLGEWTLPFTGPYGWLMAVVPGLDGLRVPARLATIVSLALAAAAAIGLNRLSAAWPVPRRRMALTACGVLIALEGLPGPLGVEHVPSASMAADRAGYNWLRAQGPGPLLELPIGNTPIRVRYLFETLVHRHRIVNGYSGYGSALQDFIGVPFRDPDRIDDALTMARALGIRWVSVHQSLFGADRTPGDDLERGLRSAPDQVARVEDFGAMVVAELRPMSPPQPVPAPSWPELAPSTFKVTASHNAGGVGLALDRDPDTRWSTGAPQQGDEWIEVRFEAPVDVARVRLELNRRTEADYPRGLRVTSTTGAGAVTTLFEGSVVDRLALSVVREPLTPGMDLDLPPNSTSVLRLALTGRTRVLYWSVTELRVWARQGDVRVQ